MAHLLQISDGTTTISLSTTNVILQHFVPTEATLDKNGQYQDAVETIEIAFSDTTTTAIQAKKASIDKLLAAAKRRAVRGNGIKVFLKYQPHNDSTLWRSEILEGRFELAEDAMTAFVSGVVKATLIIKREYYWEGTRVQASLSNQHGSSGSGVRVYGHDDAANDNWVLIGSSTITGSLPTPLEIHIKNDMASDVNSANWYIGNNSYDTSLTLQLEGESVVTGGTQLPVVSDNTLYSNGKYMSFTGATAFIGFDIPNTVLSAFGGRWAKIMLKANFPVSGGLGLVYVRPVLQDYYGSVTIYSGNEVLLRTDEDYIQDLGNIPLPPGRTATDWQGMRLQLQIRSTDGSSQTVGVDFIHLLPVDDRAYRHIEQRGMVLLKLSEVVDDGIEDELYFYEGLETAPGSGFYIYKRHPILIGRGTPIYAMPGVAQKIHFLFDGTGSTISWTYSITIFFRQRRLTI